MISPSKSSIRISVSDKETLLPRHTAEKEKTISKDYFASLSTPKRLMLSTPPRNSVQTDLKSSLTIKTESKVDLDKPLDEDTINRMFSPYRHKRRLDNYVKSCDRPKRKLGTLGLSSCISFSFQGLEEMPFPRRAYDDSCLHSIYMPQNFTPSLDMYSYTHSNDVDMNPYSLTPTPLPFLSTPQQHYNNVENDKKSNLHTTIDNPLYSYKQKTNVLLTPEYYPIKLSSPHSSTTITNIEVPIIRKRKLSFTSYPLSQQMEDIPVPKLLKTTNKSITIVPSVLLPHIEPSTSILNTVSSSSTSVSLDSVTSVHTLQGGSILCTEKDSSRMEKFRHLLCTSS
ncbi:hypothetical protein WA158_002398 [Blastocystis sp. Blastoise]